MEKRLATAIAVLKGLSIEEMEAVITKVAEKVSERQLETLGEIWHEVMVRRLGKSKFTILKAEDWIEKELKNNMRMEPRHVAHFCARELRISAKMVGYLVKVAQRVKARLVRREMRAQQRVEG